MCSTSYSTHPPQPVIAHVYICVCSDYTCCALIGFISNVIIIISENKQSFLDKVFLIAFCTKQNVIKKKVFTKTMDTLNVVKMALPCVEVLSILWLLEAAVKAPP